MHQSAPSGQEPEHDPERDTTRLIELTDREAELADLLGHRVFWTEKPVARMSLAELRQLNRIMEWSGRGS